MRVVKLRQNSVSAEKGEQWVSRVQQQDAFTGLWKLFNALPCGAWVFTAVACFCQSRCSCSISLPPLYCTRRAANSAKRHGLFFSWAGPTVGTLNISLDGASQSWSWHIAKMVTRLWSYATTLCIYIKMSAREILLQSNLTVARFA